MNVTLLLVVLLLWQSVNALSDTFGSNPQHEFGDIWSQTTTKEVIPFWKLDGETTIYEDFVRLTPDRQSKRGLITNTKVTQFQNWEIIYKIKIHGNGFIGADGLAFWYTSSPQRLGSLFGATEDFSGLGLVIDTYDNDGTGDHPHMMILLNDGTKHYEHNHNQDNQGSGMDYGGCLLPVSYTHLTLPTKRIV
eukprot:TRINITY_DN1998_c0_g1_i6.p1 TRINITY_DN1998_c0_g1~~TRINITY_DN1998_c0_g1_i6.p1  ORF type:complete len:192 (+),score=18.47 TRINITY_DN1998_c0_g1_i6:88-663(+)